MVGVFGATVILHGTLVLVPLLVEELQAGNAQTSGFVLLGISALGAIAAPIGGRMSDAVGRRQPAVIGMLACVVGLAVLWLVAPEASTLLLGLMLALVGFGMGLAGAPRQAAAFEAIEPERVGMAAGTYLTGRYIGGAIGATLAGAVLGGTVTAARRLDRVRAAHRGRGRGHDRVDVPALAGRSDRGSRRRGGGGGPLTEDARERPGQAPVPRPKRSASSSLPRTSWRIRARRLSSSSTSRVVASP